MRRTALAVCAAALLLVVALAPPVQGGLEGAIPESTAYTTQRKVARLSDGSVALAYVIQVGGENRVQVVRSTDGVAWTPLDPPSMGNRLSDRPSLAADSRDVLHLAWTELTSYDRQVFYAAYEGGAWSAPEQVSETIGYSGFPSLAVDSQDQVRVVWYGYDGTYYQVYYRARDASGWGVQRALTSALVDALNPALAIDPQDVGHVVWYHLNSRGTGYEVSYVRVGTGPSIPDVLSTSGDDAADPTIAIDAPGRVIVAWTSSIGTPPAVTHRIALTILGPDGWSVPVPVSPSGASASRASVALDGSGAIYVFYQSAGDIVLQRESAGSWGDPVPVSGGGSSSYPSARWATFPQSAAETSVVDVVWTETVGTGHEVKFRSLQGAEGASLPPGTAGLDTAFAAGLGLVLAALVWLGRPRRRHT